MKVKVEELSSSSDPRWAPRKKHGVRPLRESKRPKTSFASRVPKTKGRQSLVTGSTRLQVTELLDNKIYKTKEKRIKPVLLFRK